MNSKTLKGSLPALQQARDGLRTRWATLSGRDQRLLTLAALVFGAYLLWALAIGPAWRALAATPLLRDRQDAQWQQMQALAAQAQALRGTPPVSPEQAQAALAAATERLAGKGKLSLQGQRALLSLSGVSGDQLRDWLAEARVGARARVVEATLTQSSPGLFDGSLTVALGARP